jgi:hypothetical protein
MLPTVQRPLPEALLAELAEAAALVVASTALAAATAAEPEALVALAAALVAEVPASLALVLAELADPEALVADV